MVLNKKGQVAFFLMPGVAILLIVFSLFVFLSFKADFSNKSGESSAVITGVEFANQYMVEECKIAASEAIRSEEENIGDEFSGEILSRRGKFKIDELDGFYSKIEKGEFEFEQGNNEYFLKINGVTISFERGDNKLVRTINLNMRFDSEGKFLGMVN